MTELKLKIRNARRENAKTLDLSNLGFTELPPDISQLHML